MPLYGNLTNRGYGPGTSLPLLMKGTCLGCSRYVWILKQDRACWRCTDMLWCAICGANGGYNNCSTHNTDAWELSHPLDRGIVQ